MVNVYAEFERTNWTFMTPHFLKRRALLLALGITIASACVAQTASAPLTLSEVVQRNTDARGGAAALDAAKAIAVDVEIVEGKQTLNGRYAANTDGMVRIDIYMGGKNVYAEGVDREGVWLWKGEGAAEPSKATGAANALTHGAENHLFGWHRFAERGHKLALMPSETIDGISYPVVEVRYSTGHVSYFYVDPNSWLAVRRRDERAYHPDVDPTKKRVESRFYDFEKSDGIVTSRRSIDVNLADGSTLSTNRTLARRVNPALGADYFDRSRRAPSDW